MREIPPNKGGSQEHFPPKGGSNLFQKRGMPKLQKFQYAGGNENPDGNLSDCFAIRKEQKEEQTPKNFVEYSATIIIEPPMSWASIKFGEKAQRRDDEQG